FLENPHLTAQQDEKIVADRTLSNNDSPGLVRPYVHKVEDFDELMSRAEAKQGDVFEGRSFPGDRDPCLTTTALDVWKVDSHHRDIVLRTALMRQRDTRGHEVRQWQTGAQLCQIFCLFEIIMEAI